MIRIPPGLRWLLLSLCCSVFFAAIPWWNPVGPEQRFSEVSVGIWLLVFGPLIALIGRGYRWALKALCFVAVMWVLVTASYAWSMKHYGMGFFAVFLALYWKIVCSWAEYELGQSFLDYQMHWYEGLPRAIPGITCTLPGFPAPLKLCRLDEKGMFVFTKDHSLGPALEKICRQKLEATISFRNIKISCMTQPIKKLPRGVGVGLRFEETSIKKQKELGDLIEQLRGEGYV